MVRSAHEAQNDYAVRHLAELICGGLPSKAYLDEYLAIYYFVLRHCRYMRDPRTHELVRSPKIIARQILQGRTPSLDCDDMGVLICSLDMAVGGEPRIATVAFRDLFYKGKRQHTHVFAQAKEPQTGKWVTQDPVAGGRTREMLSRVKSHKFWRV